jgi:hypothetical protein
MIKSEVNRTDVLIRLGQMAGLGWIYMPYKGGNRELLMKKDSKEWARKSLIEP